MKDQPALFIGRFQPFHKGHLRMIKRILKEFDRIVIGIGSAQFSNTEKNPYSAAERKDMIAQSLKEIGARSFDIIMINDLDDHSRWVEYVVSVSPQFKTVFSNDPLTVQLFRERGYDVRELPLFERHELSGTEVRRRIIEGEDWESLVPRPVARIIRAINGVDRIKRIGRLGGNED